MIDADTILNTFRNINEVARAASEAERYDYAYYDARIALLRSEKEELLQMTEEMVLADPFMGPVLRKRLVDLCIRMGSNDKFKEMVS